MLKFKYFNRLILSQESASGEILIGDVVDLITEL